MVVLEGRAAAFVIAPGVAVTNAHNAQIIGGAPIIGESRNYDLLFFHVDRKSEVPTSAPAIGEQVIAYGQGASGELRESRGTIALLSAPVQPRCETCLVQTAFTFEGDAGPGFSGGPVVDAKTGRLSASLSASRSPRAPHDVRLSDQPSAQRACHRSCTSCRWTWTEAPDSGLKTPRRTGLAANRALSI